MSLLDITTRTKDPQLLPYTCVPIWRKLAAPITINMVQVTRYQVLTVSEYLEPNTGEIIKAVDLRNDPRIPPQIHVGEIMFRRSALMASLRKEVRDFAYFILRFRNNRRGVTPAVDTLVEWYAKLHAKRVSNVRRYVKVLEDAGLLAGSSLLSPLFQRTGKNTTTKDHLSEDSVAAVTYMAMRIKAISPFQSNVFVD